MFLEIDDVLTKEEVTRLREIAKATKFVDGRISNPHNTAKNNLQADPGSAGYQESSKLLTQALFQNEDFVNFAFPKMLAPPLLCRYQPKHAYGIHTDTAIIQIGNQPIRTDLSCTMFLEDPATYEGGALKVHLGTNWVEFKGKPGSIVVYPSTTLHEVMPVTKGERLVAITFIESQIPDQTDRELLYSLNEVAALEGFNIAPENRTRLEHVRQSLRRRWSS